MRKPIFYLKFSTTLKIPLPPHFPRNIDYPINAKIKPVRYRQCKIDFVTRSANHVFIRNALGLENQSVFVT